MKICWDCEQSKSLNEFYASKRSKDGRSGRCKNCEKSYKKAKYKLAKDSYTGPSVKESTCTLCKKTKPADRFARHVRGPGGLDWNCLDCMNLRNKANRLNISTEKVSSLLKANECEICKSIEPGGKYNTWHIDHCHSSGNIRGILCHNCNTAIGLLKENISTLQAAIKYIKRHSTS